MAIIDATKGVTLQGPVTNIVATAAAAVPIFQRSTFAQQLGTRSFRIKRLLVRNNAAGTQWLAIGTGIPCVANMPMLRTLNDLDAEWGEDDLPDVEFFADMTAYLVALAPGGTCEIQVEVQEIG
jgi:hypothetical protein